MAEIDGVVLQPDGYNHAHAHVRLRGGTLGALAVFVLLKLHLPLGPLLDVGDDPHDPDCTPTVAVGTVPAK